MTDNILVDLAFLHAVDEVSQHAGEVALQEFVVGEVVGFELFEEIAILPLLDPVALELHHNLLHLALQFLYLAAVYGLAHILLQRNQVLL